MRNRATLLGLILLSLSIPVQAEISSSTMVLATEGDGVPEGGGRFKSLSPPAINNYGDAVFSASLFDTEAGVDDDSGIYTVSLPSGITPSVRYIKSIAREGRAFIASGQSYELDDLYPLAQFSTGSSTAAGTMTIGTRNNISLKLPVRSNGIGMDAIIAVEEGDNFTLVVEAGRNVDSGNGQYRSFTGFSLVGHSSTNRVTFFSALDNTDEGSADNTAIFQSQPSGEIPEIARKGHVLGASLVTHLASIRSNWSGATAFLATDDSGASIPESKTALYRTPSQNLNPQRIIGEGDHAPTNGPEIRVFSQIGEVQLNNRDDIGFSGVLRDADGFVVSDNSGLYLATASNDVVEILREGEQTPDNSASYIRFADESSGDVPRLAFNDEAEFAFAVDLALNAGGTSEGVFRASESEVVEIARRDDVYEDGTLRNFGHPLINNYGLVAFSADLYLGTINGGEGSYDVTEAVIVLSDGNDYVTVAREGQDIDGKELRFLTLSGLNDHGDVVYKAEYSDGTESANAWKPRLGWDSAASSGNWDDAENWTFSMLPDINSDYVLESASGVDIQGPAADTQLNSMSIGGTVNLILGAGSLTVAEMLAIENGGTISGAGLITGPLNNEGIINIANNGTLELDGDVINHGDITIGSNAELIVSGAYSGEGAINGPQGVARFNGEVSPGNSPGLLNIAGNSILGGNSHTTLELAGSSRGVEFDAIDVGGTLQLAGTLEVALLDNFTPQAGDTFLLIEANGLSGSFETVNLPTVADLEFRIDTTQTSVILRADAKTAAGSDSGGSSGSVSWVLTVLLGFVFFFQSLRLLNRIKGV